MINQAIIFWQPSPGQSAQVRIINYVNTGWQGFDEEQRIDVVRIAPNHTVTKTEGGSCTTVHDAENSTTLQFSDPLRVCRLPYISLSFMAQPPVQKWVSTEETWQKPGDHLNIIIGGMSPEYVSSCDVQSAWPKSCCDGTSDTKGSPVM